MDKKLIKNLISISIILSLLFQIVSFADTNVNAGAGNVTFQGLLQQDALLGYAFKPRGVRVSIWDVEDKFNSTCLRTQNIVMYEDTPYEGIVQSYENISTFRCLSNMNKYEIAQLHGELGELESHIFRSPDYLGNYDLNSESVPLPNMYATTAPAEERIATIKAHFQDNNNMSQLGNALNFTDEETLKFNENKLALLLEPLMTIYKVDLDAFTLNFWMLTSAELGTLALSGYADRGEYFDIDHLQSTAYKRLPYGSFKDKEGAIFSVPACPESQRVGKMCLSPLDWADMINFLGCFEITSSGVGEVTIKFHPNGEQLGVSSEIDESYTKKVQKGVSYSIPRTYPDNMFKENTTYKSYTAKDKDGKVYTVNSSYTFSEDVTLYCNWKVCGKIILV